MAGELSQREYEAVIVVQGKLREGVVGLGGSPAQSPVPRVRGSASRWSGADENHRSALILSACKISWLRLETVSVGRKSRTPPATRPRAGFGARGSPLQSLHAIAFEVMYPPQ